MGGENMEKKSFDLADSILKNLLGEQDEELKAWIIERSQRLMQLMTYYKCAMMEIETKLNVLSEEHSLIHERNPISSIQTRLKTFPSIKEKLERKGLDMSVESIESNLFDVAGVRVICPFPDDVYTVADALLRQDDVTLVERKDYIKEPKPNGYRSLHLIVEIPIFLKNEKRLMKVEIQMRTIAMDFWASLEHQICYKKDAKINEQTLRELRECADMSAALDEKMNGVRLALEEPDE